MQKGFPVKFSEAIFPTIDVVQAPSHPVFVQIVDPEFSSVCPRTGLPDYARVILHYMPDNHLAELKAWKLFLRAFYGVGIFHEEVTSFIGEGFVKAVKPISMELTIDWGARGGLHTTTKVLYKDGIFQRNVNHKEDVIFDQHSRYWNNR